MINSVPPLQPGCPWYEVSLLAPPNVKWCEASQCSWITEPANTWSNLAYIIAAVIIYKLYKNNGGEVLKRASWYAFWIGITSGIYHASYNFFTQVFDFFEGVVKDVLYDNMKTVVIERDAYGAGRHRFNSGLWDFARHYGFQPKLCKPYRAKTKGKVERFNHYLRYSFFVPLASQLKQAGLVVDVAAANQAVRGWLRMIANPRVHGTTGKVPQACWETERTHLQPLPAPLYDSNYPKF